MNLEVLTRQLDILGVPVDTANNGIDGLNKWRQRPYALVLMDIHMPDMDGFELTRQIRAEEALSGTGRRTPIIALTANAVKSEVERCLAAGMDGYLTKPLTFNRLRETLRTWLKVDQEPRQADATSASADASDPIDRSVAAQLVGDDAAVIDRLLARFAGAGVGLIADIAAAAGDAERLTGLAHKLKGAARTAGATRLGELAAALERSGSESDVAALQAEWQRVCMALPNRSEIRPV